MLSAFVSKLKILSKALINLSLVIVIASGLVLTLATSNSFNIFSNKNTTLKKAQAAAPNTGDIIIGKQDNGTTIDLSVCVRATDGPINLTDVSNWFQVDNTALTSTEAPYPAPANRTLPAGGLLESGQYGNNDNGYTYLRWLKVAGTTSTTPTQDQWALRLEYTGNGSTSNAGLPMKVDGPELFGKVRFNKIAGSTGSTNITMTKNTFLSTQDISNTIVQNVVNVTSDCRNSLCPANSASITGYNTSPTACVSQCTAGNYLDTTTYTCKPCTAGNYCPANTTTPIACPTNQTSAVGASAQSQCTPGCPPGKTLNGTNCDTCPAGTYCSGTTTPTSCPSNTSSPAGSTSVTQCTSTCPAGKFLNVTNYTCDTCPVGKYCGINTTTPSNCPANTTSIANSQSITDCTPNCPAGSFYQSTGSICNPCPVGSYCAINTTTPVACPVNTTSPANSTSSSSCISNCPTGKFLNTSSYTCDSCPSATPNSPAGSTGISSCSLLKLYDAQIVDIRTSSSIQSIIPTDKTKEVFLGKFGISDPYICGEGSYGQVLNAAQHGVSSVIYEFYKTGSEKIEYRFNLKLNSNGEFFLPISSKTNIINEGEYKILYYAIDNQGNKGQGEYTALVTDNCNPINKITSIRTGGLPILEILIFTLSLVLVALIYKQSKSKSDLKLKV